MDRPSRAAPALYVRRDGAWPQLNSSGSYTRARTSKNGLGALNPGKWYDLFQAGFDANWELDARQVVSSPLHRRRDR